MKVDSALRKFFFFSCICNFSTYLLITCSVLRHIVLESEDFWKEIKWKDDQIFLGLIWILLIVSKLFFPFPWPYFILGAFTYYFLILQFKAFDSYNAFIVYILYMLFCETIICIPAWHFGEQWLLSCHPPPSSFFL